MTYDFYFLFLLATQEMHNSQTSIKKYVDSCKNSSIPCMVTQQLFINKHNGYVELYSIYDLANTDELCLPKSPKLIMTAKNFMNFMMQKNQILQQQPDQFFIAIDSQGHAHLTTDLQSITKKSFFGMLQQKLSTFFTKQV